MSDRVFIPIRFVAESMQASVAWNGADQSVTISRGDTKLTLRIGDRRLQVYDGQANETNNLLMDVAPILLNARTLLPIRFVAEALGCDVGWDDSQQKASIVDVIGYEQEVLRLTNIERESHGLPALRWDSRLAVAARKHSEDMAGKGYFSHQSDDGRGLRERLLDEGFTGSAGENIAAGQVSPEDVVEAWMNSEGHRENILLPIFTHLGVGFCYSESSPMIYYWTQDFGEPISPATLAQQSAPASRPSANAIPAADYGIDPQEYENEVLRLTNIERARHGLTALIWDDRLAAAARKHSLDMARRDFISHTNPDGEGPGDRLRKEGFTETWAENLAGGQPTPQEAVDAWMDSPNHRDSLLNPIYTHLGVGFCFSANSTYQYYYTQCFGRVIDADG